MEKLPGVFPSKKKDGSLYFRSSITYKNKHISLGSFSSAENAHKGYLEAKELLTNPNFHIENHNKNYILSFSKWVSLINFRDNAVYCKTPIYLKKNFFLYYYTKELQYKFDVDDLFYYSKHSLQKRGGHLFVAEYGMQINILSRYGIKNFAVENRDYRFVNGDHTDLRYRNIEVINKYYGVCQQLERGIFRYVTKIHVNGDYRVGVYATETEAAVAYNKAVDFLLTQGIQKNFQKNYILELNEIEYAALYNKVRISKKIKFFSNNK
ncbi:MAG: hypothetical protein HFJ09_06070 [Lachnospiraceae bacterium]|nr:hypothetical protein [Lachnospiraceae bacterium]